jgi:hypothetical protein
MNTRISRHFFRLLSLRWPRPIAIAFCGLMGMLLPAAFGMVNGIPEPVIHDEFSYLLGADTFAHGRLTNPQPPLPEFFEAPHVLVAPSYNSKYPPGQALMLALGQVVGGQPIWGVWLSCGFFAASLCWMLQCWTSRQWALATALVGMVTLGVSSYWAQSYWGGMVAAWGSALLFGALRRTCRSPRVISSVLMGLGVLVLANTRPYEGLLVCIPAAAILGHWLIRSGRAPLRTKLVSWMLPFGAVLLIGGGAMAIYNRGVTGDWRRIPHDVHTNQYFHQGAFLFNSVKEPERTTVPRVASLYILYQSTPENGWRLIAHTAWNLAIRLPATAECAVRVAWNRERREPLDGVRGAVFLFVLAFTIILADQWVWFCMITLFFVVLGGSIVRWWYPHYAAPVVPLLLAAGAVTMRRLTMQSKAGAPLRKIAPAAVVLIAGLFISLSALCELQPGRNADVEGTTPSRTSPSSREQFLSRSEVKRRLEQRAGSHLVFVHYDVDFSLHREWVYNSADLNTSRVIFVHDLGGVKNSELIAAYRDRSIWILRVSTQRTQLELYPG